MDYKDIITLLNAGYTKAEIDALMQPAVSEAAPAQPAAIPEQSAPAAPAQPAAIPEQSAPAAQPAAQPAPAQQPTEYERLEALLNKFIGVAQAGNLNSGMTAAPQQGKSATDILGAVIAPPQKGQN